MLMSAGELADYEVVPILIDFDVDNGDLVQTRKLMRCTSMFMKSPTIVWL